MYVFGDSVMTIEGAGLGAAASGPCTSSSCKATDVLLQQLKEAAEVRGWPAAIAQRIVAADNAWQALKASSAVPPAQAVLDTRRVLKALLSEVSQMKGTGGGGKASPPFQLGSLKVPRWTVYGGGALALGLGLWALLRHRGGGSAPVAAVAGYRRRRR